MKPRNRTLAAISKNDPGRFRSRTVETEKRKLHLNRSRRKRVDLTVTVEYLGT